jgi:D-alanine-D-alanine ligase
LPYERAIGNTGYCVARQGLLVSGARRGPDEESDRRMKKLRILVLVREGLVPPATLEGFSDEEILNWKVEFDVVATLKEMGHEVRPLGVIDDLGPIRQMIMDWSPDITFVLLEEFHGVPTYDYAIVSYLELMRQHYTGCNPIGMMLSRNKAFTKRILSYHRISTPQFAIFPLGRKVKRPKRLEFPLLVKSAVEDASFGIAQASIVGDDASLVERVRFVHESIGSDALAEQYVEGRELYVGVVGNQRLQSFPTWEMDFSKMPDDAARIATAKVKWDLKYRKKYGIDTGPAKDLPPGTDLRIAKMCKRVGWTSGCGPTDVCTFWKPTPIPISPTVKTWLNQPKSPAFRTTRCCSGSSIWDCDTGLPGWSPESRTGRASE